MRLIHFAMEWLLGKEVGLCVSKLNDFEIIATCWNPTTLQEFRSISVYDSINNPQQKGSNIKDPPNQATEFAD